MQGKPGLDWVNVPFLAVIHVVGIVGTAAYASVYGVTAGDVLNGLLFYLLTGLALTAGYHRYFSHRTYDCHPAVRWFYLVVGAGGFQGSAYHWASLHRDHHRYVDTDRDPYDISKGMFWAHIGCVLHKEPPLTYENAPDLARDRLVMWQHRWFIVIAPVVCFGLPALLGWALDRPMGGLLWGGFLRLAVGLQVTFCINSVAHLFGTQPFTVKDSSRDNWWLAALACGEGYHNFHHRFPGDYRQGPHWSQWDASKWFIRALRCVGAASSLRSVPDAAVAAARAEADAGRS